MTLINDLASDFAPLQREQILHALRAFLEMRHRTSLTCYAYFRAYRPRIVDGIDPKADYIAKFNDFCNKIAPFYLLQGRYGDCSPSGKRYAVLNHLYERWYTPNQDIEYGQFIGKIIQPLQVPEISPASIQEDTQLVAHLHAKTVQILEGFMAKTPPEQQTQNSTGMEYESIIWDRFFERDGYLIQGQKSYTINPLFRATAVVLRTEKLTSQTTDIGSLPAILILTGDNKGLKAPITFNELKLIHRHLKYDDGGLTAVETSLDAAIEFLIGLDSRERALASPSDSCIVLTPELPVGALCDRNIFMSEARKLGWTAEMGNIIGPSSQWIGDWTDSASLPCPDWEGRKRKACSWHYRIAKQRLNSPYGPE
ncbi:hypothetical protein K4F52_000238 [Lecanicillium sp. MT-2017a]|nr:hypothetical protein K4F52_000238 [Lecanicillium sp. MT-2017a]